MNRSKIKKLSLGVYLAFAALPMTVFAAGLGQLNVSSGIGEPLKADIQLLSVSPSEKGSLKARIAPQAAYTAQGLVRPASHNDIRMRVTKSANGENILKLYSNKPMAEPFLDMLVELEWETGRILREYTVLLDPPGYERDVSAAQIQTPAIKTVDKGEKKTVTPIKNAGAIKDTPKSSSAMPVAAEPAGDYLTRKGDTLSKIANRMKPAGVSLDQMLVGLYEANPEAFDGKNMNRLKVGKILQPPTEEALNAVTQKGARKAINVHTANWKQYRNTLAGVVAESTPEANEVDSQAASGKVTQAKDKSAPQSSGPKDVVKLSSGDAKAQADMEAKIVALQEEVSAREKGLQEAKERTSALEKQIEDLQKLLTLKNNALSNAPESIENAAAEKKEGINGKADAEPKATPAPEAVAETPKPAEKAKPTVKAKPITPPPAPVEEPSFITSALNGLSGMLGGLNATLMAAGAGIIALLVGAWLYLRNKRRKNLADFEQGIMTSGGLKANTVFGNTSGASVDTGDTSFLTDFSQSTSGGMIDTNDVDPIAEAEVYMAYGRDAQAEEILKDAISKEPKRYELHLKLLEMYAASKSMSAFEAVSGELYTTLGAEDPTWAKVAEIGKKLDPNNPLYQVEAGVGQADVASEPEAVEAIVETPETSADGPLDAADFSDSPLAAEADLDFSLNDEAQAEPETQDSTVEQDSPIDVVAGAEEALSVDIDASALNIPSVEETLDTSLDFDLDTSATDTIVDATESITEEAVVEMPDDGLDFANTMPSLELPSVEAVEQEGEAGLSESSEPVVEADTIDTIIPEGLTLDLPQDEEVSAAAEAANEPSEEALSFDVPDLGDDTVTLDISDDNQDSDEGLGEAGVLDMTDISLDMDEDIDAAINEATPEAEPEVEASESEEVETKLELVVAYIDMEDKEGAKELLDEVLKEGGANQRKRAEELLATLG